MVEPPPRLERQRMDGLGALLSGMAMLASLGFALLPLGDTAAARASIVTHRHSYFPAQKWVAKRLSRNRLNSGELQGRTVPASKQ